jgi:hypothetical protein
MASWKDDPKALSNFTPYIQQLPVDAMVSVGMEKQRRYDEGVQRIQATIDRVAGLDIVRDVDKSYMKSKLNELGTKLRTVAAGDFSDYQLTNSVAGMASSIAKDPNIVTAVTSTAFYRKQLDRMDADRVEGKSDPANEFRFNRRAGEWLSSTEIGQGFGTNYIAPVDVWAKIKDIGDKVGIDSQEIQQLFQTDELGNTIYEDIIDPVTKKSVGKKPVWNSVMVEKVLKGKDAGKILKAFESALTPADYQQLAIEGEYSKASYTPEMLKEELKINGEAQMTFYTDKIQALKIDLVNENSKNTKDPERIGSIESQIGYFEKSLNRLAENIEKNYALAESNPDAVRASLYTRDYLHNMSKALSSQDVSINYSVSPGHTVTMDINRLNRDIQNDKIAQQRFAEEMRYKWATLDLQEREFLAEFNVQGGMGDEVRLPIPGTFSQKDIIEEEFDQMTSELSRINDAITLKYYKETNKRNDGESPEDYERRIRNKIKFDSKGDEDSFKDRVASIAADNWSKGENVPVELKGLVASRNDVVKSLDVRKGTIESVKKEALLRAEAEGVNIVTDEQKLKMVKPTSIRIRDDNTGQFENINLTQRDVLDFAYLRPRLFNSKDVRELRKSAEERLKKKFGDLYSDIKYTLYGGDADTQAQRQALMNTELRSAVDITDMADTAYLGRIENEIYNQRGYVPQAVSVGLKRGKTNEADFNADVSVVINKYRETAGEMRKLFAEDDAVVEAVAVPIAGGVKYQLVVSAPGKDDIAQDIDINDYMKLAKKKPELNIRMPVIVEKLDGKETTNRSGDDTPSTAHFTSSDFPGVKNYKVTADYVRDGNDPNMVWMKLYMHNPDGTITPLHFPDDRDTNIKLYLVDPNTGQYNTGLDQVPLKFTDETIDNLKRQR